MSAYDQYLSSLEKEDQGKNQLVASLSEAATANPDEFANMVKLSRAAKVSVDAVADYKTEAQQAQYLGDVGLDRLWRDAPKTANFLTVPENAKLAKDDHENLTGIEGAFDWLKNRGRAIGAAIPKANAGLWGMAASPFELLGIDSVGGYLRDQQRTTNRMAKAWGPQDNPGWMTNAIDQGLTSAGQQLVTLPMAFLPGGQNAALTAMVAPVFGESYGKARDKGLTPAQSIQYGTQDAAAEWVFERYGLGNLVKNVKAGTGYGRTLVEFMLREVPSEMATTVVQSFNEYANVNPDKPVGEWAAQLPDELAQTVVATLVGGSAISTTAKAVDSAVRAVEKRAALAEESSAMADMLGNINQYIAASTTLQRDPQTFATFIEQATEDGPVPDVFISAQTLQQSGLAEQLAAVSPAVAEQFQTALETGGDIRIPVAEYATAIAPTEYAQGLIDHLKVEPEGMSRAEAQEYLQSGKAQELQTEVDRILAEQTDDGVFRQSAEAVRSNLQTQLDAAARFTPEVNSAYASMVGNFYTVMAAKLGITPEDMFDRFPLQIGAESVAGQQFAQNQILDAAPYADDPRHIAAMRSYFEKNGVKVNDDNTVTLWHTTTPDAAKKIQEDGFFKGGATATGGMSGLALEPSAFFGTDRAWVENTWGGSNGKDGVVEVRVPVQYLRHGAQNFKEIYFEGGLKKEGDVWKPVRLRSTFVDRIANKRFGAPELNQQLNQSAPYTADTIEVDGKVRPTTNSNGKPIAQTEEGLRNFWRWFGDSKVVDAEGRPLVVYHGTAYDFDNFDAGRNRTELNDKYQGDGFHFSPDPQVASRYADANRNQLLRKQDIYPLVEQRFPGRIAQLFRDVVEQGYEQAWDLPDAEISAILQAGRDANVDLNDLLDLAEVVEGSKYHAGRETANDPGAIFSALFGDSGGGLLSEYHIDDMVKMELDAAAPTQNVMPVYLKADNPLVTDSRKKAKSAQKKGHDGILYSGPDLVAGVPEWVVFNPTQIKSATGNAGTFDPANPNILMQSAFHGSPHKFDKFMLDHIGTGEGNQAFGWGLYFAGNKEVAEFYRSMLGGDTVTVDGKLLREIGPLQADVAKAVARGRPLDQIIAEQTEEVAKWARRLEKNPDNEEIAVRGFQAQQRLDAAKSLVGSEIREDKGGQLYEVEIPEDDTMLLWDKPLSEQPAKVRAAAKQVAEEYRDIFETSDLADSIGYNESGESFYRLLSTVAGSPQNASRDLNRVGISGIKYLDGTSRPDGDGSFNYVIFDDNAVEILNTYYQNKGDQNRGAFNPATLQVTLLKAADLSTFLHESGHFFLEVQIAVAEQLQKEAEVFGLDTLKPGEQQIVQDAKALMEWFGLRDLAEWNALDFEEKRTYHEQFARGFEAYLFDGKAPSIEMQGLFQRFRAWLLSVYRDLKALNVELTDEVRGVMDRMLATNEHIATAEQGRSMMPLFTSAEQAGMTPEEFAAYQALGVDATNDAIQDLQARGLRDMQWLNNARGRVIKQLQQQSKEIRAAVQMDVRREVMAMPIYRAWSFLTGKRTADDTFENPQPAKSSPDILDETIDSLFVAMAKLGGINKDEAVGTWGIDPADKPSSGVFGKPVWRREGGLSLDGMLEALAQHGYLELDENGKPDLREFEDKFKAELGGDAQYSTAYDYAGQQPVAAGEQLANPQGLTAGRLDLDSLAEIGLPVELVNHLKALRMTAKSGGLHADLVAEMFGFTSGDELTRTLAAAEAPKNVIEAMTDLRMLEQYGDLSSPQAIERAADKAIHNDARARMVATEANALAKATGQRKVLTEAAKQYAATLIARLKVRNIKPGQYASAEVRAAKAAEQASKAGDLAKAAAEKRNQLINTYATKAAYAAQDEIDAGLRYLKKFDGDAKGLDVGYLEQITNLLERFDLRKGQSLKAIDKRTALSSWLDAQREAGFEPDIPDDLINEAYRTSYKNLTVEEFRGLVDTVKQIEHLGRLKKKLLTAKDQREYEVIRDEIATSIVLNADNRQADTRTPDTVLGKALLKMRQFWASHIKSAMWARIMDGGKDGGPMWEYFIRSANERGDMETTMRAEATAKLSEILAPVFKSGKLTTKTYFPSLKRSLTREGRIAIALNWGNEGNRQRLIGGEGWTPAQVQPVLESLTAEELRAVQAIWDHFESYRPEIGAKEKRVYGKEPDWVSPAPFIVSTADGQQITMRGGYYPIKYDPMASQRAEEHADAESAQRQLKGAYTTATTRRSFTKSRAEEVSGRPLLYSLAGVYSGVNDVIHDLAWHEWLIDTNRLLRSNTIDQAIRTHYGPEVKAQFKKWSEDIAEGDKASTDAGDIAVNYLRQSVSVAGLGFNVMSAAMQPLGITQSIVRVGAQWVGRGIRKYIAHPVQLTREVNSMSDFMANRARTRNRELNELRNQVEGQTAVKEFVGKYAYFLMMRFQQAVDVPTWWGAYEKAVAEGNDDDRAIALADQAVIDAQGGGMLKDQSGVERTDPKGKLFTVFYAFMNTAMNLGVATGMTEKSRAKQAANYALLYVIPPMLAYALKAAITPGDSGDDDPEKIARKLLAAQIDYLMGMMVYVRELSDVAKTLAGANDLGRDYQGPAGLRLIADAGKFAHQVAQGEMDDALRKSFVNIIGDLFGLPSAQINRMITGSEALAEGKTDNPAAVVFGFQEPR